jgi:outer membrane protein OmpA-like peptidoglycan-associated protein
MLKRLVLTAIICSILGVLPFGCSEDRALEIQLPQGKTAHIGFIAGEVLLRSAGENQWRSAEVGDSISQGTMVRTGQNSYCELIISSGTIFRMKDRTELQLVQIPESAQENRLRVRLMTGQLLSNTHKITYKSEETIETDTAVVSVHGTSYLVDAERGGTTVMVNRGKVRVRMNYQVPQRLSNGLGRVSRLIRRGVLVRRGFKVTVSDYQLREIRQSLDSTALDGSTKPGDRTIDQLRHEARLAPTPVRSEDRKKLKELNNLVLNYERGPSYHLSPNFDGTSDTFVFTTAELAGEQPDTGRKLESWRMVFRNGTGSIVKEIRNRLSEEEQVTNLPARITWNLFSDSGSLVEDGSYVYELFLNGNLVIRGNIEVDTLPPLLQVESDGLSFSPNGDGSKDTMDFTIQAEGGAQHTCAISTSEGYLVKNIDWGPDIPEVFSWDGTGENDTILPEGVYNLVFTSVDLAGNRTRHTVRGIAIDLRERQAMVEIDHSTFSPNGDGNLDTVTFNLILSDRRSIGRWDLIVQTLKGETARRFRGWSRMPYSITWNGEPTGRADEAYPNGLPSGTYAYFLQVTYMSGINTYSFKQELTLDNDPPAIRLDVSPELFSPDGDGRNDTLTIRPVLTDISPIKAWRISIFDSEGSVFKTFTGTGMPAQEISWDGVSDTGVLVDSGDDFTMVMEATDTAFNTASSEEAAFSVDILVIPTDRGLKIRASSVQFGHNTAELTGDKTHQVLDKIASVLQKYDRYSVIVEGHTDSTGDEQYNRYLSEKRAKSVGEYLVKMGVSADRLSFAGHGELYPVDTNHTSEGRRRNRRVEFILIRD